MHVNRFLNYSTLRILLSFLVTTQQHNYVRLTFRHLRRKAFSHALEAAFQRLTCVFSRLDASYEAHQARHSYPRRSDEQLCAGVQLQEHMARYQRLARIHDLELKQLDFLI